MEESKNKVEVIRVNCYVYLFFIVWNFKVVLFCRSCLCYCCRVVRVFSLGFREFEVGVLVGVGEVVSLVVILYLGELVGE